MPLPENCAAWRPRQNRSKMRGSSSAGIPVPVSVTVRTASGPEGPASMVMWPPAAVNFSALVSRLVMTWCSQRGSASMPAGVSRRSRVSPAASNWPARLSAAVAARLARSHGRRVRCRAAASAAARVCRSPTMRAIRGTSSRSDASWSGVGLVIPSSSASCPACRTATGVRSSCATSATRSRRSWSCRSRVSAIWSNAVASSRSSPGADTSPTRAVRSPRPMARVTAMMRSTGRVIRRAMASPVSKASTAASPAAPKMARSRSVRSTWSALASPELVNRTTAWPTRSPPTRTAALCSGAAPCAAKRGEAITTRPAWSRIWTSAPVRVARSSTGDRSAEPQLSPRSQAAAAAAVIALVRSARCWLVRAETSAAARPAVSPASRATAASATERKASASRRPRVLPRKAKADAGPAGDADAGTGPAGDGDAGTEPAGDAEADAGSASVIAGQAQPVPAAQDRLHDLRPGRVLLDLAAQVLHVRVDGALVALELIPADPVDQLEPGVHPARDGGQGTQDAPLGRGQIGRGAAHHDLAPRRVDEQGLAAVADRAGGGDRGAATQDGLDAQDQLARAERLGDVVIGAELQAGDPVLLARLGGQHQDGHGSGRAQLAGDGLAGHVGQAEIEYYQVRRGRRRQGDGLRAGTGGQHRQARPLEVGPDQLAQLAFVLYQQHRRRHRRSPACLPLVSSTP